MLTTGGATLGKAWRLTPAGVLTAMQSQGLNPEFSRALLGRIADAEAGSRCTMPGAGRPLVMAWQLVAGAGEWLSDASANDAAWRAYQDALSGLSVRLTPLLVLGLVDLFTDACGRLWGVNVTPEGRAALTDWPVAPAVDADTEACFTAWDAGYTAGMGYATKPPPPAFANVVTHRLPASAWQ